MEMEKLRVRDGGLARGRVGEEINKFSMCAGGHPGTVINVAEKELWNGARMCLEKGVSNITNKRGA